MASWSRVARRIRVPLGFVFAALYIGLAHPRSWSIAAGAAVAALGVGLRASASGHVKKNEELTMSGPYAHTRNPLYVGSILIGIGFGIASRNAWVAVALMVMFLATYVPVVRSEEAFLRSKFPQFDDYARRVPRFGYKLTAAAVAPASGTGAFSRELYLKHREYNALVGALLMIAALVAKLIWWPS
jgi:protein-S-isoprenylcysteine O-methyltransferase Ste14